MRTLLPMLVLLAAPGSAGAEPPPSASPASLVVWPATSAAERTARALSDRAAERGAFEVVDAGLLQRRVEAGGRVDVESFLGEVRRSVAAARASLGTGDPQGAIDRVEPPLRDFLPDLASAEGRATLRDLLVVRARALLGRSDPVAAAADATLAVRLDPQAGAGIDLSSLLPAERALIDRVVQEASTGATGRLALETDPSGAEVIVDGAPRGTTPRTLELPYGRHVVRVERLGRAPAAQLVDVAAGEARTVRLDLPPTEGEDLLEQLAVRVGRGVFDAADLDALAVLARALGARAVLVVEAGPRPRVRLFRDGAFVASGTADAAPGRASLVGGPIAGPWDELLARLERAALGRTGRTPGETAPVAAPALTSRWWFWTGLGAIVVGGVVTGVVLASQPEPRGVVQWGRP